MPAPTQLWTISGREPADPALADDHRSITWADLDRRTSALVRGLEARGVKPGDHVALIASNRVEFAEYFIGLIRGGFRFTPIKTNWKPGEMGYVLDDASTTAVVTDVDAGRDVAATHELPLIDLDKTHDGWLDAQSTDPVEAGRIGYRIPYTSGTTGRPKGVRRSTEATATFEQWAESSRIGSLAIGLPGDGWHLMVSQMFHGAPMAFGVGALWAGAPMRIMRRWDANRAAELIDPSVSASIMVPTMFRQLLALPGAQRASIDPSGLQRILHGGEGCPIELKRQMLDWWGPVFTEYYGFTEGGMTLATSEEWLERPGTVGKPFAAFELMIVDDDGRVLDPNETGTVYFKRPEGRIFEYTNEPAKTEAAYRADNSFTVGDIGHVDDDGYLYLSGRSAELIVAAGVNIYPAEIEAVVFDVPGVLDACVAGGPDTERGERPIAFITLAPGFEAAAVSAAVGEACTESLAGYKRPRDVVVRSEIPRDPTGKVLRVRLRDELWAGQERQV